ncbi:MAG: hypothetical protein H7228_10600 [Polaromonas sp.]|nr:hypothetical protein [Polaromonas sp.]
MKPLFPLVCAALLLSGCPDSKLPKGPPKLPPSAPEPKVELVMPAPIKAALLTGIDRRTGRNALHRDTVI